ncbi:hypothetical protein MRB53_038158 [Persea americana]|nr:hypothetical protein MRB53_038158 [Persea americana]
MDRQSILPLDPTFSTASIASASPCLPVRDGFATHRVRGYSFGSNQSAILDQGIGDGEDPWSQPHSRTFQGCRIIGRRVTQLPIQRHDHSIQTEGSVISQRNMHSFGIESPT